MNFFQPLGRPYFTLFLEPDGSSGYISAFWSHFFLFIILSSRETCLGNFSIVGLSIFHSLFELHTLLFNPLILNLLYMKANWKFRIFHFVFQPSGILGYLSATCFVLLSLSIISSHLAVTQMPISLVIFFYCFGGVLPPLSLLI